MTPEETRQVLRTAARAEEADGSAPLDEATLLHLRNRPESVRGICVSASCCNWKI